MNGRRVMAVFLGGGLGAVARDLLLWILPASPFPLALLLVNCLGAFILGTVFVLADEAGLMRTQTRLFVAVGVLGGFTTFSTFGWTSAVLLGNRQVILGLGLVAASLLGGVGSVIAGIWFGRELLLWLERMAGVLLRRLEQGRRIRGEAGHDIGLIETGNREESA